MKKTLKSNVILLLLLIIAVPIIIYIVSIKLDMSSIMKNKTSDALKIDFFEDTIKTTSVQSKKHNFSYVPTTPDDGVSGIVMGNLDYGSMDDYDWHYSYGIRDYTYCCDSYWPLIKVKDGEFGEGVGSAYDYLGDRNAYEADLEFSRLPNRNGHLVYIEYDADGGQRGDLYRGLAYLKWQNIDTDYNIQRVLWSSWVWHSSQGYGVDYMGDSYVLENKDVYDGFKMETVKYYCGRDSYVPHDIEPSPYSADVHYSYGGPSKTGKDEGWVEAGVVDYHDSTDTDGDGTVSVAEQLAPYGGSVEAWRAAVIAGIESTYGPLSRTIQFSTFEYQIVRRNFPVESTLDDIHAYVDQVKDGAENRLPSYTFGPYEISMRDGGYNYGNDMCSNAEGGETLKLKELVYNEITGGNFGQKAGNTFLTAEFKVKVRYRNGTEREVNTTIKPKYNDSSAFDDRVVHSYQNDSCVPGGAILVDPEGKALEEGFPKFDEPFYIRYYVKNEDFDNTLQELLPSDISFNYIGEEMKMSGYRFKSKKLAYSIHYNLCKYADRNMTESDVFKALLTEYSNHDYDLNERANKAWNQRQSRRWRNIHI